MKKEKVFSPRPHVEEKGPFIKKKNTKPQFLFSNKECDLIKEVFTTYIEGGSEGKKASKKLDNILLKIKGTRIDIPW